MIKKLKSFLVGFIVCALAYASAAERPAYAASGLAFAALNYGCSLSVPAPASAIGYCDKTFSVDLNFNTTTVDSTGSNAPGYKLYLYNHFTGYCYGSGTAGSRTFNGDGSITVYGNGNGCGELTLAAALNTTPYFRGTVLAGGAYICATFALVGSPPATQSDGWPAFWEESYLHLKTSMSGTIFDQWTGQVAGYEHYPELDNLEYFGTIFSNDINFFGHTEHDWYGKNGVGCSPYCDGLNNGVYYNIGSSNIATQHQYCELEVPATSTTNGYAYEYLDGTQIVNNSTPSPGSHAWSQFINNGVQSPPPTGQTWAMGIIDLDYLSVILGGSIEDPMRIYDIDIYQASAASNLTN